MKKFKEGQLVFVKGKMNPLGNTYWNSSMDDYINTKCIVNIIDSPTGNVGLVNENIDSFTYFFHPDSLELSIIEILKEL